MDQDPDTGELRAAQARREAHEREAGRRSDDPEDALAHDRRADKAAYLRRKLREREASEERSGEKP